MSVTSPLNLDWRDVGRIRPQLDGLRQVLSELGNPQDSLRSILVVGTNGKGSTAAILESVLRGHGLTTGLYTSPHLVRVEERVRLNGYPIGTSDLVRQVGRLDGFSDLTFFETLTAAAFGIFAEARVDVVVLEAGMGGSWDATRLAGSPIAGLTNVGSDHGRWLGVGREAIAADKGRALAAAEMAVIGGGVDRDLITELGAPQAVSAENLVRFTSTDDGRLKLAWAGGESVLDLPLAGSFQRDNAQLALALALRATEAGWLPSLDPKKVRTALETLQWPGRLSIHRISGRDVLVDCAHNLEAVRSLALHLDTLDDRHNLVFSCLDDKPVREMAAELRPRVEQIVVCQLADDRAMPVDELLSAFPGAMTAETPLECLDLVDDPVLATGSTRLVGQMLAHEDPER
jgi:dihydrofolate synthase/folylpolyglutamate synthase